MGRVIQGSRPHRTNLEYWEQRASQHGIRSVLNLAHGEDEIDQVTQHQINHIFPKLSDCLDGSEHHVLDFGCGVGRFTVHLANLIDGFATGVDPIQSLLDKAPRAECVEYRRIVDGKIPLNDDSVDLIWIALVLGGIQENDLTRISRELVRVLKPNGKLCLVENTTNQRDVAHWYFRDPQFYFDLFPSIGLDAVHHYFDVGEKITVMIGKSISSQATPPGQKRMPDDCQTNR